VALQEIILVLHHGDWQKRTITKETRALRLCLIDGVGFGFLISISSGRMFWDIMKSTKEGVLKWQLTLGMQDM
jgi:hypothetical protein